MTGRPCMEPIILIHRGDSPYLAHTIAQAQSSNPGRRIILLGDRSNRHYMGAEHHDYARYFSRAEKFSGLFTSGYFPGYQYPWILFCHQKYFVLLDFCKQHAINSLLLIDSDVMIYEDVGFFFERYRHCKMTVSCPDERLKWAAAFFSIVNDLSIIEKLCGIFEHLFSPEGKALRESLGVDCFYEMVGIFLLMKEHSDSVINTYAEDSGEFAVIHSVVEEKKFSYRGGFLKLNWIERTPYVERADTGRMVKAPVIHFHGKGKYVMGRHLSPVGIKIRVQNIANRVMGSIFKYPARMLNKVVKPDLFPKI